MRTDPVTSEGLTGFYLRNCKPSERARIEREAQGDRDHLPSLLLSYCVVDERGEPVKTVDEWEEYGADNYDEYLELYRLCQQRFTSVYAAKKK